MIWMTSIYRQIGTHANKHIRVNYKDNKLEGTVRIGCCCCCCGSAICTNCFVLKSRIAKTNDDGTAVDDAKIVAV